MAGNGRMTRTLARHQSAYEDAARDIQKRINTCHDVSGDAKDFFEEFRLDAGDNSQRKTQLVAQNHHHHQCYQHGNITHLNQHAAILNAEMSEWTNIMRGYTIATEESEWAANMRCQHDDFFMQAPNSTSYFENPSFTTRTPSTVFSQHPTRCCRRSSSTGSTAFFSGPYRIGNVPADSDDDNENASTVTTASNAANGATPAGIPGPAFYAGQGSRQETPRRQDCDSRPTAESAAPQASPRHLRFRDTPTEIAPLRNPSLMDDDFALDERFYQSPSLFSTTSAAYQERSATSLHKRTVVEVQSLRTRTNLLFKLKTFSLLLKPKTLFTK